MAARIVVEDVRGIPMRVFAERPRSLAQVADIVRVRPERDFLACGVRRLTDHELLDDANRIAANLQARGLQPGDRVAILSANSIDWATAFWGTVFAGGVVAALNGWWKAPEILYALGHCTPRFLVADGPRFERLASVASSDDLARLEGVFVIGAEYEGTEPFARLLGRTRASAVSTSTGRITSPGTLGWMSIEMSLSTAMSR
ncbi:MAG: class I adenylate-forming enzyme family protein [Acidimicrobiia bacterium]